MRVDVARIFDYRAQAIKYGTSYRFGPAKRCVGFHTIEINTGGIFAGSVPEGVPSGTLPALPNFQVLAETAYVHRDRKSSEDEFDSSLERKRRATRRDLIDYAVASSSLRRL